MGCAAPVLSSSQFSWVVAVIEPLPVVGSGVTQANPPDVSRWVKPPVLRNTIFSATLWLATPSQILFQQSRLPVQVAPLSRLQTLVVVHWLKLNGASISSSKNRRTGTPPIFTYVLSLK